MCFTVFIFILVTGATVRAASLQVEGNIEFKPKLKYKYRIRNLIDSNDGPNERAADDARIAKSRNSEPQLIDIIIKNDNDNPNLMKVGEARFYERDESDISKKYDKSDEKTTKDEKRSKKSDISENASAKKEKFSKKLKKFKTIVKTLFKNVKNATKVVSSAGKKSDSLKGKKTAKKEKKSKDKKTKNLVKNAKNSKKIDGADKKMYKDKKKGKPKKHKNKRNHIAIVDKEEELVKNSDVNDSNRHTVIQTDKNEKKTDSEVAEDVDLVVSDNDSEKSLDYGAPMLLSNEENNVHPVTVIESHKKKHKKKLTNTNLKQRTVTKSSFDVFDEENGITVEDFPEKVTGLVNSVHYRDLYVKPRLVKDDPKIREFTKHMYEQTIKTFENIKSKLSDYALKQETDRLMRSYEEKFGDFVRETQNQKIKTRLGSQKVILNTLDTSNRILDRLTNYLIGKMDNRESLRTSGAENIVKNEVKRKKELENKHVCTKLHICRSKDSFTNFIGDVLTTVLSSNDKKITEFRDASTEVLINTDFSSIMNEDTEQKFRKKVRYFETMDVNEFKAILAISKNMLSFKNSPIKALGKEDSRLNRTVSFFEITDLWDKNMVANEPNVLEWNDLRNSFKEWSEGKRKDIVEIMQSFVDVFVKANKNNNFIDNLGFDKNVNTVLGY